jgi:hypothetical protein
MLTAFVCPGAPCFAHVARLVGRDWARRRGVHRQGYDLQLTQYDDRGWRATFYATGMEHTPTCATGTAWERAPWHAHPARGVRSVEEGQRELLGTLES